MKVQDRLNLLSLSDSEGTLSFVRKKQVQQVLNEASRLLRQAMHSISHTIEVWDRFSSRDAEYLSDILRSKGATTGAHSPFRAIALIGDHINDLRELQHRAQHQQDLCADFAREVCIINFSTISQPNADDYSLKCKSSWKITEFQVGSKRLES